jgi:polysaccharide biosynthesis/export protein
VYGTSHVLLTLVRGLSVRNESTPSQCSKIFAVVAANMKRLIHGIELVAVALLSLQICAAALGQDQNSDRAQGNGTSRSSLTGAGAGGDSRAANAGRADGLGNPLLGGQGRPLYRLRPSDVVEISFTVAPEFNQTLTVQPDGYVLLKDAGMVPAEGLNLNEFRAAVEKAYQGYLHDPEAAIALKDFEKPYYIVGGEVGRPGKYDLRSEVTVSEAVQIAGGLTTQAKHSQVILFRRVNDELVESRVLNLKQMLKQRRLKEDARLEPGDMIFVPQNTISKIDRFLTRPSLSMYMDPSQF